MAALAVLVLFAAGLELITRFGFSRISRIESRTLADYRAALATRQGGPAHPTTLLLGNSLLLEAVDTEELNRLIAPRASAARFVIEQTTYLDWRYGIERLLSEGSRPDRIVLATNLPQLMVSRIRGESSAYYLFRTRDIPEVGQELGYDLTSISGLYFARYSMFYAGRNNIRNFILFKLHPGYGNAIQGLVQPVPEAAAGVVLEVASKRLRKLREICAAYNVDFQFLLPPAFGRGGDALREAGGKAGVRVLMPVPMNSWDKTMFRDGFHATPEAATRFTKELAPLLLNPQ